MVALARPRVTQASFQESYLQHRLESYLLLSRLHTRRLQRTLLHLFLHRHRLCYLLAQVLVLVACLQLHLLPSRHLTPATMTLRHGMHRLQRHLCKA